MVALKEIHKIKQKEFQIPFNNTQKPVENHEIAIWKKLNHPNIVKLFEVIYDKEEERSYLISEYIDGGSVISSDLYNILI